MEARFLQARKSKSISLKKKIYIYCNGKTEANYFEELRAYHNIKKEICVIFSSQSNRLSLVKEVKEKHTNIKNDKTLEVFVVFDADIMPKGTCTNTGKIKSQVDNACKLSETLGYTAIISNESFELWFLLHFEDITTQTHRDDLLEKVKQYIPNYKKATWGIFQQTYNAITTAKTRAQKIDANYSKHIPRSERNPSTNVYKLVEVLESLQK